MPAQDKLKQRGKQRGSLLSDLEQRGSHPSLPPRTSPTKRETATSALMSSHRAPAERCRGSAYGNKEAAFYLAFYLGLLFDRVRSKQGRSRL